MIARERLLRGARAGASLGLFGLVACSGGASVFAARGPAARGLSVLGFWVIAGLCLVTAIMLVLIVWAAVRRRGSLADHAPIDEGGGQPWIFLGGFLVPSAVLFAIFVVTLRSVDQFPLHRSGHVRPDIRLVAHQWWWEVHYLGDRDDHAVTTANEIHVPLNWPVDIELVSDDVIHSFWVAALHGKVDVIPGHINHIQIEADTPGRYEGQCSEYCGAEHANMRFAVVAEPLDDYERWLAGQARPAAPPADAEARRGEDLFETRACGLCHAVRGTPARATVGPDLTHVASRAGLAADMMPNSRAYLEAWITHAQSLKWGARMPDLTEFDGDELQAISHYLESLR